MLLFLGFSATMSAQSPLESMVKAEKAFAKMATDESTKRAFVHYLSDSSIVFQPGPVAGKPHWEGAGDERDWLTWEPEFADISQAGDMGYTTGPFEYRSDRKDEKPAGTGHFLSIWKNDPAQGWKVMLDIGIGHAPAPKKPFGTSRQKVKPDNPVSIIAPATFENGPDYSGEILEVDRKFSEKQATDAPSAYQFHLSEEARIFRPTAAPYDTPEAIAEYLKNTDKKYTFEPIRAIASASGDLAYVYGGGMVSIPEGDTTRTLNINYVRIWKKDGNRDWKIVADLVSVKR